MADLIIPDISEFQGAPSLAGLQAVIIRAHNGWRADNYFAASRANARTAGCQAVGLYQYLPSSIDAAGAARTLLQTVGALHPGEWLICDLEEGVGDQGARWQAWAAVARTVSPVVWLYTGLNFAVTHNLQPEWVAAYQTNEPSLPHRLWQNTDTYPWPWGRSDASIYHGTVAELVAAVAPNQPTPAPTLPAPPAPPIQLGDTVQAIPFQCTLDANGWTAVTVPLPAGKTKNNVVGVVMDVGSPFDEPASAPWAWASGQVDYQPNTAGTCRVVVKGDPGKFFTGRVNVA